MKQNRHISLDEIGKDLPFSVPEGYFDNFAQQMEEQIIEKRVSIPRLLKPWLYMVAMFTGVLLLGQVFYSLYQDNNGKITDSYESYILSQVHETSIMDYYLENPVD